MKHLQLKFEDKDAKILEDWAKANGSNFTVESRRAIIEKIQKIKNDEL